MHHCPGVKQTTFGQFEVISNENGHVPWVLMPHRDPGKRPSVLRRSRNHGLSTVLLVLPSLHISQTVTIAPGGLCLMDMTQLGNTCEATGPGVHPTALRGLPNTSESVNGDSLRCELQHSFEDCLSGMGFAVQDNAFDEQCCTELRDEILFLEEQQLLLSSRTPLSLLFC